MLIFLKKKIFWFFDLFVFIVINARFKNIFCVTFFVLFSHSFCVNEKKHFSICCHFFLLSNVLQIIFKSCSSKHAFFINNRIMSFKFRICKTNIKKNDSILMFTLSIEFELESAIKNKFIVVNRLPLFKESWRYSK